MPQYTFRNRCDEEPGLVLQDGTAKYYFNCTCEGEEIPENIQALYRYIMTGEAMDELTEKLEKAVEAGRHNEKWRVEYMKELLHDDDIREEERENTEREKARADAQEARADAQEARAEQEKANAEREKSRADAQEARADSLEEKVRELEAIINKMKQ